MQLEIKLIIDFGDQPIDTSRLERVADSAIQNAMGSGAFTAGHDELEIESWKLSMGWTSSGDDEPEDEPTYRIQRFFRDPNKVSETIKEGLTLDEAKEHCNDQTSQGEYWFDGFERE